MKFLGKLKTKSGKWFRIEIEDPEKDIQEGKTGIIFNLAKFNPAEEEEKFLWLNRDQIDYIIFSER